MSNSSPDARAGYVSDMLLRVPWSDVLLCVPWFKDGAPAGSFEVSRKPAHLAQQSAAYPP